MAATLTQAQLKIKIMNLVYLVEDRASAAYHREGAVYVSLGKKQDELVQELVDLISQVSD